METELCKTVFFYAEIVAEFITVGTRYLSSGVRCLPSSLFCIAVMLLSLLRVGLLMT